MDSNFQYASTEHRISRWVDRITADLAEARCASFLGVDGSRPPLGLARRIMPGQIGTSIRANRRKIHSGDCAKRTRSGRTVAAARMAGGRASHHG